MSYIPPTVERVAQKIARVPGVELSAIARDGAVDAVIEGGYNRPLREQLLRIGHRSLVPVRVFYRMSDGRAIGESEARSHEESIEDFYTDVHVSGFVGSRKQPDPATSAGDAYGDWSSKDEKERDDYGQLKLCRLRTRGRGRPVVGWKYGKKGIRKGDKVKFSKAASLRWTMGRTVKVRPGATGYVSDVSTSQPILYLQMGNREQVEVPVHAIGHIYDVMLTPSLEHKDELQERSGIPNEIRRLVMAVGFGRAPGDGDTPTNTRHFMGPSQPDLIGYTGALDDEDQIIDPKDKPQSKTTITVDPKDKSKSKTTVAKNGERRQVLFGGEQKESSQDWVKTYTSHHDRA